jgi:hypothetical protein
MKIPSSKGAQALVAAVFAALAIRLFLLTARYSVNIFFWDQWDFDDANLFEHHPLWEVFRFQHGPHRQGLGSVLAALIEPWFQWNSRTEAFVATAIVVLLGLSMLYLKYRLFGVITWTDVVIPIIVFTPAQWESLWNTLNFAHGTLPVLLILVYCAAWTWRNQRLKYAAITALNFLTLYTGFGIFLGLLTPVLLTLKYRELRGKYESRFILACAAISVACLLSFFVGYHNDDASGCKSLLDAYPEEYLQFLCVMFVSPFGLRGVGIFSTMFGGAVLTAVVASGAMAWKRILQVPSALDTILATLSTYTLLFCGAATLGRTCTGLMDAHASRYTDYKELFVLGLYFWILTLRPPERTLFASALPLVLIPSLFITAFDLEVIEEQYQLKSGWRSCYLAGRTVSACDNEFGPIYPQNERTHLQQKLDYLRETGQNLFAK